MAYQRKKLSELLQELKDTWESSPFWTDAEAIAYLNHSMRTWNLLTGYWKRKVLLPASGTPYQTLPASLTFGMQVVWGPTSAPLQPTARADLDFGRPRWEEELVTSGGTVPTRPILWAPVALMAFAVWPTPAAGADLLIDGVAATPVLSVLDDYADVDDGVASAIVGYALNVACFKRSVTAVQATAGLLQGFLRAAVEQNARLRHSTYFRKVLGLDLERSMRRIVGTPGGPGGAAPGAGG